MEVASLGMSDDVTNSEVIRKSVTLHFLRKNFCRCIKFIHRLEFFCKMPFALVCGVIPCITQEMTHSFDVGGHAVDPGEIRVVEHFGVLNVLTRVKNRSRRSAHTGVDPMVFKHHALLYESFVSRESVAFGQLSRAKIA